MSSQPTFTDVLKNKAFRYLWINQLLLQLVYNTLNFALIIWVFKLTDSNFAVSALILSIYVPSFLFGFFAGVFVDMADRKKIILWIDFLLALSMLIFLFVKNSYPLILLNTFFMSSLSQFFAPAESSSIPMVVEKKQLLPANSLFSLTLYGSVAVGYSMAGPILSFFGINAIFLIGFVCLFLAFLLSGNLPKIVASSNRRLENFLLTVNLKKLIGVVLEETKDTLSFIRGRLNVVTSIILLSAVQGVIGILAVVFSSYMERVLKIHATDASYVLMLPLGLGMVLGALFLGKFGARIPKRAFVLPAITLIGVLFFLAGITPTLAQLIQAADLPLEIPKLRFFHAAPTLSTFFSLGAFIMGVCSVVIIISSQTILQENTNQKIRGKVFATLFVTMNAFAAIPVLLTGALSDFFGVTPIFMSLGVIIFITGILAGKPAIFFAEHRLPFRIREFLGLGHWER